MPHARNDHDDCTPCYHNNKPPSHTVHIHYDGRAYHYPTTNHDHNPTGGHHHHNKYGNILYCPNDDVCAGGARFSTYYDYEGFSFGLADHTH